VNHSAVSLCHCGPEGTRGLAYRRSARRIPRHRALNDLVWRALGRTNILAVKEPAGLVRLDRICLFVCCLAAHHHYLDYYNANTIQYSFIDDS